MQRAATIDDLRIKLCYICREEELHNRPAQPLRRWVHPCKCTLVAHESCLLEWIRASENNPDKATSNILKCPQCDERYGLESDNPLALKIMDGTKVVLSNIGMSATLATAGVAVVSIGAGVYMLLTSYGVFALYQLVGPEMGSLLLGESIEQWSFHAFLNLPMIPLSLILSRTKRFQNTIPLISLMMLWPTDPPAQPVFNISSFGRRFLSIIGLGDAQGGHALAPIKTIALPHLIYKETIHDLFNSWPPSPMMFNFGLRFVRRVYSLYMQRFRTSILGDKSAGDEEIHRAGLRQVVLQNFHMEMRLEDGDDQPEGDDAERQQGQNGQDDRQAPVDNQADQLQDDNNVRLVLDGAEDAQAPGLAPPEVLPPAQEVEVLNPQRADVAANMLAGRARQNAPVNANQNQAQNGNRNPGGENADRARVRLRMTGGALGNLVFGSLIIPPLASFAGSILLRLALPSGPYAHRRVDMDAARGSPYSPRRLLCRFLAVRPPGAATRATIWQSYNIPDDMSTLNKLHSSFAIAIRMFLLGTPTWRDSDPVWWRNTIGLGLCFVAKDLISIWYQYLSQREIRSRRLKDRPFEGIDPAELDLRPEFR